MADPFLRTVVLQRDRIATPERYPFALPAFRSLDRLTFDAPVTFFVGENGSGKSTLLEAIAVAAGMRIEGGSRNFTPGDPAPQPLAAALRLIRSPRRPRDDFFFRAETFYNVASEVERLEVSGYGDRGLHDQSHGEAFLTMLTTRFRGDGLYLLDEPEAALSPARQLAALARMGDLVGRGSQFVVATHAPILMAYPGASILSFGPEGIRPVAWRDTEHYQITRAFLEHPERMLRELLGPA